mmetsp:Transcript_34964/g.69012  ORF Transcript_34964/g.69012 Transcript_34964/m.69012 type:complete len:414 (-) Transcript_34964:217-1458(-)
MGPPHSVQLSLILHGLHHGHWGVSEQYGRRGPRLALACPGRERSSCSTCKPLCPHCRRSAHGDVGGGRVHPYLPSLAVLQLIRERTHVLHNLLVGLQGNSCGLQLLCAHGLDSRSIHVQTCAVLCDKKVSKENRVEFDVCPPGVAHIRHLVESRDHQSSCVLLLHLLSHQSQLLSNTAACQTGTVGEYRAFGCLWSLCEFVPHPVNQIGPHRHQTEGSTASVLESPQVRKGGGERIVSDCSSSRGPRGMQLLLQPGLHGGGLGESRLHQLPARGIQLLLCLQKIPSVRPLASIIQGDRSCACRTVKTREKGSAHVAVSNILALVGVGGLDNVATQPLPLHFFAQHTQLFGCGDRNLFDRHLSLCVRGSGGRRDGTGDGKEVSLSGDGRRYEGLPGDSFWNLGRKSWHRDRRSA